VKQWEKNRGRQSKTCRTKYGNARRSPSQPGGGHGDRGGMPKNGGAGSGMARKTSCPISKQERLDLEEDQEKKFGIVNTKMGKWNEFWLS